MPRPADDRPVYWIAVRAEGEGPPAVQRLKCFLKGLLRSAKLRCVDIRREPPSQSEPPPAAARPTDGGG
jgi:hypothetical protein